MASFVAKHAANAACRVQAVTVLWDCCECRRNAAEDTSGQAAKAMVRGLT